MIVELSVALIAVAVSVLVVYLIMTLKSARASLNQVNDTLIHLQGKLDELSQETLKLIQNTNQITVDAQTKMKQADGLFHSFGQVGQSIGQVGESIHQVTDSMKQMSAAVAHTVSTGITRKVQHHEKWVSDIVQFASLGIGLWKKWKNSSGNQVNHPNL